MAGALPIDDPLVGEDPAVDPIPEKAPGTVSDAEGASDAKEAGPSSWAKLSACGKTPNAMQIKKRIDSRAVCTGLSTFVRLGPNVEYRKGTTVREKPDRTARRAGRVRPFIFGVRLAGALLIENLIEKTPAEAVSACAVPAYNVGEV